MNRRAPADTFDMGRNDSRSCLDSTGCKPYKFQHQSVAIPFGRLNVKRFAVLVLILGQLWLASPLCCCALKAALIRKGASSEGACCCAGGDDKAQNSGLPERDRDCRCAELKQQVPAPLQTVPTQTNAERNPVGQLFAAPLALSLSVADPTESWITPLVPPPLGVADRLHQLHRLNL